MTKQDFISFFDSHRMLVFNFCNKILDSRHDAEDITSSVFVKMWGRSEDIPLRHAKAFVMISAKNECMDYIKANRRYLNRISAFSEKDFENNDIVIDTAVLNYIYSLIDKLPEQGRSIIYLKYREGYTRKQIADKLNIKQGTVSNALFFYMEKIRAHVESIGLTSQGLKSQRGQ